jgi:hypothetical protein
MAHYFFHLQNRTMTLRDSEGVELTSLDEIRGEAMHSAREIMSEQVLKGKAPNHSAFIIEDENGKAVLTFPFKLALQE